MSSPSPQRYRSQGRREGIDEAVLANALAAMARIRAADPRITPVLTLRHLSHLTETSFTHLRDIVARRAPDQYKIFYLKKHIPGRRRYRMIAIPESSLIVADLFGEDRYFADSDAFWTKQNAEIDARREAYLDEGWSDVVVLGPREFFSSYEHRKAAKRKGGRVYIDVNDSGEVTFHEGYVTDKEAKRLEKAEAAGAGGADALKPVRPELTSRLQTYVDLHRHAAVRATLTGEAEIALRLLVAHAIAGSPLWTVRVEAQSARRFRRLSSFA